MLVVSWCAAVAGRRGGSLGENSRFGEFNSRLGRREFPVRAAPGIRRQACAAPGRAVLQPIGEVSLQIRCRCSDDRSPMQSLLVV